MFHRSAKVDPETLAKALDPEDNSSESETEPLPDVPSTSPNKGPEKKAGKRLRTRFVFDWDEMLEDLDVVFEDRDREGRKSDLFRMEGKPLKKNVGNSGLHLLTEEVLKSYGLEFLNLVVDVVVDVVESGKVSLENIVKQMQHLDYQSQTGPKLILWVEDDLDEDNPHNSFGRLLLTELLLNEIEPHVVLASYDLDEDILLAILQKVQGRLPSQSADSDIDFAKSIILKLLRVGLSLCLAATRCKIMLVDADKHMREDQEFLNLLDFAEMLGHKVLYLRSNLTTMDKPQAIQSFLKKVKAWTKKYDPASTSSSTLMSPSGGDIARKSAQDAKSLIEEDIGPYAFPSSPEERMDGGGDTNKELQPLTVNVEDKQPESTTEPLPEAVVRKLTTKKVSFCLPAGVQFDSSSSSEDI